VTGVIVQSRYLSGGRGERQAEIECAPNHDISVEIRNIAEGGAQGRSGLGLAAQNSSGLDRRHCVPQNRELVHVGPSRFLLANYFSDSRIYLSGERKEIFGLQVSHLHCIAAGQQLYAPIRELLQRRIKSRVGLG
jgi:hypothetical protein